MSLRPDLRLDWCEHAAARYACERWHYSGTVPAGKNVYLGVWEGGVFIGAVVFGMGSGNSTNGARFGLRDRFEVAELARIALRRHRSAVSRVIAIAVRLLRRQSPGLRLLISFADPKFGHHGGVYQASGWHYAGLTKPDVQYRIRSGWVHHRTATSKGSAAGLPSRRLPCKHRYLLPLDDATRAHVATLAQPYPKRVKQATTGCPSVGGGAAPTHTLQSTIGRLTHADS